MFSGLSNKKAFWSLVATRIIYAVNWYNVAAIFFLMGMEFGQTVGGLGILASSFYLGVACFQVPGGILAAKFGPKKTAVAGTLLCSSSSLLVGLSPTFFGIALLRFLVGAGMAFVFAPGVTLVAKYYKEREVGLGIGLYNSAFAIGGAVGIFGWAVLAEIIGWRSSLVASGGVGIFTGASLLIAVPRDSIDSGFRVRAFELKRILFDSQLLVLSIAILGNGIAATLISSFMVYYLETVYLEAAGVAGLVGSLVLLIPVVLSPIGGRLYDKSRSAKRLLLAGGVVNGIGVALAGVGSVYAAVAATVTVGIGAGIGFTVGFAAARDRGVSSVQYETLVVAWANSVSLFAGFWSPLVFSSVASGFGYPLAWFTGGLYTLLISFAALAVSGRMRSRGLESQRGGENLVCLLHFDDGAREAEFFDGGNLDAKLLDF